MSPCEDGLDNRLASDFLENGTEIMTRIFFLIALAAAASLALEGAALAKQRSAKDQALFEKARKECNGNHYPGGAHPVINYKKGTFRCQEAKSSSK